jgi:hypothetical protein
VHKASDPSHVIGGECMDDFIVCIVHGRASLRPAEKSIYLKRADLPMKRDYFKSSAMILRR